MKLTKNAFVVLIRPMLVTGLALACASVMAQSSVNIGGTMDVGVRDVHNGSIGSGISEVSGSNSTSKLVIQGTEDLGGGLNAGFYFDSTIAGNSGVVGAATPAGQFFDRQSTVRLGDTTFGELRLGRDWVPTHLVWSSFDPFYTLGVASANTFRNFAADRALGEAFGTGGDAKQANSTLRVSNAIEYFLPGGLDGVYGSVTVSAGEGGTTADGFTNGDGFRVGWKGHGFDVAAAQFITRNANIDHIFRDQVLGVSYNFDVAKVSVAQRRWVYETDATVNTQFGVAIPVGPGLIKLTYVRANQTSAAGSSSANDSSLVGAGYAYFLSKTTQLYVNVARIDNGGAAVFTIPGGPAVSSTASASNYFGGQKSTAFEVGIRHDF